MREFKWELEVRLGRYLGPMKRAVKHAWGGYRGLWERLAGMPVVMRVIVLVLGPLCLPLSIWALITGDLESALRGFVLFLLGVTLLIATLWLARFEKDEPKRDGS